MQVIGIENRQKLLDEFTDAIKKGNEDKALQCLQKIIANQIRVQLNHNVTEIQQRPQMYQNPSPFQQPRAQFDFEPQFEQDQYQPRKQQKQQIPQFNPQNLSMFEQPRPQPVQQRPNFTDIYPDPPVTTDKPPEDFYEKYPALNRGQVQKIWSAAQLNGVSFKKCLETPYLWD